MLPMPMRPIASSFAIPVAFPCASGVSPSANALISCRKHTDRYGPKASSTQTQYRIVWGQPCEPCRAVGPGRLAEWLDRSIAIRWNLCHTSLNGSEVPQSNWSASDGKPEKDQGAGSGGATEP